MFDWLQEDSIIYPFSNYCELEVRCYETVITSPSSSVSLCFNLESATFTGDWSIPSSAGYRSSTDPDPDGNKVSVKSTK